MACLLSLDTNHITTTRRYGGREMSCVERDVEDLHQDLGSGAYGFVKKMRHKETGLVMAVKVRASFGQLLRDTVRSDQIGSDSLLARLWLHRPASSV